MSLYRYELHCHTQEGSTCSRFPAAELVRHYKEHGYDGVFISDHLTGSTSVPRGLSHAEHMAYFSRNGYGIAREEGEKIGLKVFFGPELSICGSDRSDPIHRVGGNDFLVLGTTPEWWQQQTDFFSLLPRQQFDRIHAGGGFLIHAHPFLQADWVECIRLFPAYEDAVEVINGHSSDEDNARAAWYAQQYGLLTTAGTDAHSPDRHLCGVEVPYECLAPQDVIAAIRSGAARPFAMDV